MMYLVKQRDNFTLPLSLPVGGFLRVMGAKQNEIFLCIMQQLCSWLTNSGLCFCWREHFVCD